MFERLMARWKRPADPKTAAMKAFRSAVAALTPDDLAVDCGANVGRFTVEMAASGAKVFAFEPNPAAFAELIRRTSHLPHVTAFQVAVADQPGTVKLFLHENAEEDPVKWSTGSSLLPFKGNVRPDTFVTVEAIDLTSFIEQQERPVALIKLDIEGAEIPILQKMLDRGLHRRIRQIFVEVHDEKIRELADSTADLRRRLAAERITNVNLEWQ